MSRKMLTLKEFRNRLARLNGKSKDNFIRKELNNAGEELIERTKKRTPVDTGLLKRSWEIQPARKFGDNWEVILRNPVDYASYVEFGHRIILNGDYVGYYEPRYMATRSINEVNKKLPKELNANLILWFDNTLSKGK